MKWHLKIVWPRWLASATLIFVLATGQLRAAGTAENNAWNAACKYFQDAKGPTIWALTESKFADFAKKYPASEHYPEAIVFEARALFEQEKYDAVIELLSAQAIHAGKAADQFAYWTAKAFFKKKNYETAADNFARLIRENPTSTLRPEAIFREAEAHAKLEHWPRVIEELGETNGTFQEIARTNRSDDLVVSGLLLLGEAELAQTNYPAAEKTLSGIVTEKLRPELEWDRQSLLCRVQLASGQAEAALRNQTNLLAAAVGRPELKAKSVILLGEILERLNQWPEAIQVYETNLGSELPADRQRQALLRIVELMLRQNKTEEAGQRLHNFLESHPDAKDTDLERLIFGELQLKEYYGTTNGTVASASGTNLLQLAEADFTKLIQGSTNSQYLGKAELNLGWCYWTEGKISESQAAFSNAVKHLTFSEDQAVARFKLADIFYAQKDFGGAITNYRAVIDKYSSLPAVKNDLFEQALYQIVRASLEQTNLTTATEAMNQILTWFPQGALGDRSMLLVGQASGPVTAREVFSQFITRFPESSLLPEVKLAIARTYEKETNWLDAITQYNTWVKVYTNSSALPRAEFSRAWSNYKAGNESNAYWLFTNFVAHFQTNELAATAQYWVGDYYMRLEDFQNAELSYKEIFTKWTNSSLAFQARMMAGRAAMAGQSPQAATNYFINLTSNPDCPPELVAQAAFAWGDATMSLPLTNNPSKYSDAIEMFRIITTKYSNRPIAALAWGRLGDCYYAIATNASQFEKASNAFEEVMAMEPNLADATTRSMAEFRLGQTLAAMSRLAPVADQKPLFTLALDHWLNVIHGDNLRDNEPADLVWAREAGLEAGKLAEELGEWNQAVQIYQELLKSMPPLRSSLEKKIAKAQENLLSEKK